MKLACSPIRQSSDPGRTESISHLGAVDGVQPIERLLEDRAQFVVERCLAREDGVPSCFWCSNHPQHGIGRGVGFEGVVAVILAAKVAVLADVAVASEDCNVLGILLVWVTVLLHVK